MSRAILGGNPSREERLTTHLEGLQSKRPEKVAASLKELGGLHDVRAFDPVLPLTKHPNPKIQNAAFDALARIHHANTTAVRERLIPLLNGPDWIARNHAMKTIGRLGDPSFTPDLLNRFHNGDSLFALDALNDLVSRAPPGVRTGEFPEFKRFTHLVGLFGTEDTTEFKIEMVRYAFPTNGKYTPDEDMIARFVAAKRATLGLARNDGNPSDKKRRGFGF